VRLAGFTASIACVLIFIGLVHFYPTTHTPVGSTPSRDESVVDTRESPSTVPGAPVDREGPVQQLSGADLGATVAPLTESSMGFLLLQPQQRLTNSNTQNDPMLSYNHRAVAGLMPEEGADRLSTDSAECVDEEAKQSVHDCAGCGQGQVADTVQNTIAATTVAPEAHYYRYCMLSKGWSF